MIPMHRATAAWCSLLASNCTWSRPSTKRRASPAASSMSSNRASSRHKDRLRFLKDAAAAQVVAALLDGPAFEQVDRSPESLFQCVLQVEEAGEAGFGAGFEFDQQ